jgi:hypothetical protein
VTLAVVRTHLGEKEILATLTEDGWSVPDAPVLGRILNMQAAPGSFAPAYGGPETAAADAAAKLLAGTVAYVAPEPDYPSDAVF